MKVRSNVRIWSMGLVARPEVEKCLVSDRDRHRRGRVFAVVFKEGATGRAERFAQRLQGRRPSHRGEDCVIASLEGALGSFRQRHGGCSATTEVITSAGGEIGPQ